ncbi:hypothetical protein [Antarcticimicrobium sediminis]|uniref:Uncharacterized protein n=1 Tax=Antarcticimicrobium sediminis TaxID=2546227 RepID=A0A4R5EFB6_9RHOB|nr:hypothetical protein [Antarcticimicrobium sediminis]TDE33065.1 hypothetical protein E1B25_21645 [Antarcticimicrobium sediminis]
MHEWQVCSSRGALFNSQAKAGPKFSHLPVFKDSLCVFDIDVDVVGAGYAVHIGVTEGALMMWNKRSTEMPLSGWIITLGQMICH